MNDLESKQIENDITPEMLAYSLPGAWMNLTSDGELKYYDHTILIEEALLRLYKGKSKKIVINLPAQTGKSVLCTGSFPSWLLGRHPNEKIGIIAYEADFAEQWSRENRNKLEEYGGRVFGVTTDPEHHSAKNWGVIDARTGKKYKGSITSAGMGGSITGRAYTTIILEDPIKSTADALSPTKIRQHNDWLQGVLFPRIRPETKFLLIMTRWSTEDPTAWLIKQLKKTGEPYEHIVIPGIADSESDPLNRPIGAPLWPEQRSIEFWEQQKMYMGTHWFQSIIQQKPIHSGGNAIKMSWFRRFVEPPARSDADTVLFSIDTASKDTEINDYSVIMVWLVIDDKYYLVDLLRDRMEYPTLQRTVDDMMDLWKPHDVIIESRGNGVALAQYINEKTPFSAFEMNPEGSKKLRMDNESPAIRAGHVYLPMEGTSEWVMTFESEVSSFPNVTHDDQIDALSLFLKYQREASRDIELW